MPVAIRLTPTEVAKADRYGAAEFRSRAAFARLMFLRGMAAYERECALEVGDPQCGASASHRHADALAG
ncbi:hypothetical protein AU476_21165 [Cupriavidus sp. UYMSc13B]|nr:hypothetical protein AU476_21165 [Cupriavidus sp. UYMSc13B]